MISLKTRNQITLKQLRCTRAALLAVPVVGAYILATPPPASALAYIDSPTGAQVDRFSSGFGTTLYSSGTPAPNTNSSYIGLGYDLSGVGWLQGTGLTAGYDARRVQSVTMITPLNFAIAAHYSNFAYFQSDPVDFANSQGSSLSANAVSTTTLGVADFAIGTLAQPFAANQDVAVYRVLDVASHDYNNLPAVVYGSQLDNNGPTIGNALMAGSGGYDWQPPANPTVVGQAAYWQGGDSGSPLFIPYKAPGSSNTQLTFAGTCWTANSVNSYLPSTGYFGSVADTVGLVNSAIQSEGYALKWTIYDNPLDPANTAPGWTGAAGNGDFASALNWSKGTTPTTVPNNLPVLWNADTANGQTHIALGSSNVSLRGMLFKASTSTAGFTISGTGTLSIDYTGIRNESSATQTFNVPITLIDSQNWEAANGNLVFNGTIDTSSGGNNYLVVVGGNDNTTINGVISGSGLLAKDNAGTLTLNAANTYSGNTIIHNGTLSVDGTINSATTVSAGATLGGSGSISAAVSSAGTISPGDGGTAGTLRITDLTLNNNSSLNFILDTPDAAAGTGGSSLLATTDTTLGSGIALNIAAGSHFGSGVYHLISFSNAMNNITSLNSWTIAGPSGYTYMLTDPAGMLNLNVTAVPEPAAIGLLLLGGSAALLIDKRRKVA